MKKTIMTALAALVLQAAFVWAGGNSEAPEAETVSSPPVEVTATMAEIGIPLKTPITVRWWAMMNAQEAQILKSYAEKTMFKNLERLTNIHIEFEHPSAAAGEAFNLLLASGDLPDIIQHTNGWKNVAGGLDGLIDDKVIMDLTPLVNTAMPNFRKLLNDYPDKVDALMKTGEGRYWGFNKIYIDESCWAGPIIRQDYLTKFNQNVPTTIAEWDTVLKAFKAGGIQAPLGFLVEPTLAQYGVFTGAYGVRKDFYVETDGKIHYGPIEQGYRRFLETFTRWYQEGLIDPEFASVDNTGYKAKAVTGVYGAFTGSSAEHFAAFNTEIASQTPGAGVVATPYPRLNAGQTLRFRQASEAVRGVWTALSAQTKYAAEICKMFDYMFSLEGGYIVSYGNEGEAYTLNAEGKPVATELLTNNPAGSFAVMATKYCGRNMPFWIDPYECYFLDYDNSQTPARLVWDASAGYDGLRPSYPLPAADTQVVNRAMADIRTYTDEMMVKFIMGQEPLSGFDAYVQNIKRMGIDDVLTRHNAAYANFLR